jgi:hypothetical protein
MTDTDRVAYITETLKLAEYIEGSENPLLQVVRTHQHNANALLPCTARKCKKNRKGKGCADSFHAV